MTFQHSKKALTEENLYRDCLEILEDAGIVLWWRLWAQSKRSGNSTFMSAVNATIGACK